MSDTRFNFCCDPWDLEDEGLETALGRLAGEIGVDSVTVTALHPGVNVFRPRARNGPTTLRADAAAWFQPDIGRYSGTRIRPPVASAIKSRNPLDKITASAKAKGLTVHVAITCCNNATLVSRNAMASSVDVFGDPRAVLCPSSADVREYLAAIAEDLSANYAVDAVELHAADFGGTMETERCLPPHTLAHDLMNWCFCAACRQRATETSVDAEAVAEAVKSQVHAALRMEQAVSFESALQENELIRRYHETRLETVTTLVKGIRSRCGKPIVLKDEGHDARNGWDRQACLEYANGLVISRLENATTKPGVPAERVEIRLDCHPGRVQDGPSLVKHVREAADSGCASIGFDAYGAVPEPCLDWVRQAIRYTKRS